MYDFLINLVRALAEGRLGQPLARAYWWAANYKSKVGFVLGLLYAALRVLPPDVCGRCPDFAGYVLTVSGFLLAVGLVDRAIRATPPIQPVQFRDGK